MMTLKRPGAAAIEERRVRHGSAPYGYEGQGLSRDGRAAPGYVVDHNRIEIGLGEAAFRRGRRAIEALVMFPRAWTYTYPAAPRIDPGEIIALLARGLGVWSLNYCRIVYVIDEPRRFGFAYGTLEDHVEKGEERFLVEWDPASDVVTYDLFAFSKPRHILARVGYRYVRSLQRRFQRDSLAAMQEAGRG